LQEASRGGQAVVDGPGGDLGRCADAELIQDVLDVLGCGSLGDHAERIVTGGWTAWQVVLAVPGPMLLRFAPCTPGP
jgi:hypothetical protein